MHQQAGVKLHQDGMPKAPTGGLLVGDKQDEKPNCLTRDVTESSSHGEVAVLGQNGYNRLTDSPKLLRLPHCSRSSQAPLFPYSM